MENLLKLNYYGRAAESSDLPSFTFSVLLMILRRKRGIKFFSGFSYFTMPPSCKSLKPVFKRKVSSRQVLGSSTFKSFLAHLQMRVKSIKNSFTFLLAAKKMIIQPDVKLCRQINKRIVVFHEGRRSCRCSEICYTKITL
jgi:hypothetical protein